MTEKLERVHWMMASRPHTCCECGEDILPGMRFAHWIEVLAKDCYGKQLRVPHDYCAECGRLLEDSLTTTETVS